ncbi:MAG: hypothetical protein J6S80_02710 [Alphaproteobacteria bacterium]|nr:hypothetical protein [Alphaproteobacteria bacterium]
MLVKPHHGRGILWTIVVTVGIIAIALLVVPNFINLNKLRPHFESAVFAQTGVVTKIHGDVNFGILGSPHLMAHGVETKHGITKMLAIKVPFSGLFDLANTEINGIITAYEPHINVDSLSLLHVKYQLYVKDAIMTFMGKDYKIIRGLFSHGTFDGQVRTNEHKYDIAFQGNNFTVKNKNLKLNIRGEYFPSGGAAGILEINTNKINDWFGFDEPKLLHNIKLTTNFYWDGGYGFKFMDIEANNVHGDITLEPNGWRTIRLYSDNTPFDFSFLSDPDKIMSDMTLNIDFHGDLVLKNRRFEHVKIDAVSTKEYIQINKVIADSISLTGGTIDKNGAHEIIFRAILDDKKTECLFTGTDTDWRCDTFTYGDISGSIKFKDKTIEANITSNKNIDLKELESYVKRFGAKNAMVKFKFANMGGTFTLTPRDSTIKYEYIYGKPLKWVNTHIKLLPQFMDAIGNMTWTDETFTFTPNTNDWSLTLYDNFFHISGNDIKTWFPHIDLRAIKKQKYTMTGFYNSRGDISDLTLKIGDHVFTGVANSKSITLHTTNLNPDVFFTQDFFDKHEEMEFLTNAPIMIPFDFSRDIYLTADTLTYGENNYKNFVYSLKSGIQTFSITDNNRGNLLATIVKEHNNYSIFIQLSRFIVSGKLLPLAFPLNIADTSVTAEIHLNTYGHIAHDIKYNMTGHMDLTFDGGYITGIGIDNFYNNAENLTRLNVEDRIITALESGTTQLKTMRVIGEYNNGNFITTEPIKMSIRHADAVGALDIKDNLMNARLDIKMRAVAPDAVTVSLTVAPNGRRKYSLSELTRYFDPAFMRSFIKTHDKF